MNPKVLLSLLRLERDYDRKSFENAVQTALRNNYNNTNCWYPVAIGGDYYNAVNQLVVEVEYTGKYTVSPDCEFEPGKTTGTVSIT